MDLKTYKPIKAVTKQNSAADAAADSGAPLAKKAKTSPTAATKENQSKSKSARPKKAKPEPVTQQDAVTRASRPSDPCFTVR